MYAITSICLDRGVQEEQSTNSLDLLKALKRFVRPRDNQIDKFHCLQYQGTYVSCRLFHVKLSPYRLKLIHHKARLIIIR